MTQSVFVSLRVAVNLESAWHRVPGGVANATHHSVHAAARHHDIDVVGVRAWHRGAPAPGLEPTVPTFPVPLPRPVLYDLWHRLRRPALGRWVGDIDVVHATTAVIPPVGRAALVATIHDLTFLADSSHSTGRGVRLATRGFELARDEAKVIAVPSAATKAECVAAGVEERRIRVVPWGCDATAATDADRARVRRRYDLPETFVLWVGTLEPRKNLVGLLEAHRSVPDVPLVLVGPDGWGDIDVKPTDRVRRLGSVPAADLAPLYDLADVFVLPSHAEGFGMPLLEAMAQGTPVVTSAGTATEEVVGDAGLTVAPGDTAALAGALGGLLADESERARLGDAGRERSAEFTWEATGAALAEVYREAAA